MSSIVYPRQITKNIYDIIGSNFSKKQFVKINTLRDNTCVYDSFLLNTYKNYQEEENKESQLCSSIMDVNVNCVGKDACSIHGSAHLKIPSL